MSYLHLAHAAHNLEGVKHMTHVLDKAAAHIVASPTFEHAVHLLGEMNLALHKMSVEDMEPLWRLLVQRFHLDKVVSEHASEAIDVLTLSTEIAQAA